MRTVVIKAAPPAVANAELAIEPSEHGVTATQGGETLLDRLEWAPTGLDEQGIKESHLTRRPRDE
jgi:hypothetical protein